MKILLMLSTAHVGQWTALAPNVRSEETPSDVYAEDTGRLKLNIGADIAGRHIVRISEASNLLMLEGFLLMLSVVNNTLKLAYWFWFLRSALGTNYYV